MSPGLTNLRDANTFASTAESFSVDAGVTARLQTFRLELDQAPREIKASVSPP